MNHRLQCQCGALRGHLSHPELAVRGVCYCKDCRASSIHLGTESRTHDTLGGVEFVATQSRYVSISDGAQHLACMALTEKGLLRWYARCCNTPIGNTVRNWKMPYVGLLHTCLKADPVAFDRSFPRLRMRVNTGSARKPPPPMALKTIASLAAFMPRVMTSGITGAYKSTPFFNASGQPVASMDVLSQEERARAYSAA